jgi:ASC-1-like (ASCH) protein
VGTSDERANHFEKIGVQQRLFTRHQFLQAKRAARERGVAPGEILLSQGSLNREQLRGLDRAVTYRIGRDEDKAIAKIIIDSNYCEAPSVEGALKRQKEFYSRTGELMRLGVLLVEGRTLSESQRIAAYKIHEIERQGVASPRSPL